MLLKNEILDLIIAGRISVVFRMWKKPTVKTGGTLKTRKGILAIDRVEKILPSQITNADIKNAGLRSRDELCSFDREGDLYRIKVHYAGEDPRIALRQNLDKAELKNVCERLRKMGDWTAKFLRMIHDQPNIHAQILAESIGLETRVFKPRVRKLKALGLTESLHPGYRLSPRGKKVLKMLS